MKVQANIVDVTHLWHSRLGHLCSEVLNLLSSHLGVKENKLGTCDVCFRAKQTRTQFSISESKADGLYDLIHCDIWGSYRVASFCEAHYFLTVVDDASRATWVYLMKDRRETSTLLRNFVAMIKT